MYFSLGPTFLLLFLFFFCRLSLGSLSLNLSFLLPHALFSCIVPPTFSSLFYMSPFSSLSPFSSFPFLFSIFLLYPSFTFFSLHFLSFPFHSSVSFLFSYLSFFLCHFVGAYSSLLSFSTFFHPCPSEPSLASFFLPSFLSFLSLSPGLRLLAAVPLAEDDEAEDVAGGPETARHHRAHPWYPELPHLIIRIDMVSLLNYCSAIPHHLFKKLNFLCCTDLAPGLFDFQSAALNCVLASICVAECSLI